MAIAVGLLLDVFLVHRILVPSLVVLIGRPSGWPGGSLRDSGTEPHRSKTVREGLMTANAGNALPYQALQRKGAGMPDICDLILDDHEVFRRRFAELDEHHEATDRVLAGIWVPLGELLDRHAAAEEALFYPRLLRRGDHAEEETGDAISDHNNIRDAVRDTRGREPGSERWWSAVEEARRENSEHMAEEERGAISDFRMNVDHTVRDELGALWLSFADDHAGGRDVDTSDKDPDTYIARH